jgi:hypothetical protein
MAASNYLVGELMDRFGFSPRVVTVGVGTFFLLPGLIWFATERWWDRKGPMVELRLEPTQRDDLSPNLETEHFEV